MGFLGNLVRSIILPRPPIITSGLVASPWPLPLPPRAPGRTVVEALLRSGTKPVVGSIVCCRLAGVLEHSGVYVGHDRIIHRDGGGFLASVTPEEFLARLDGRNPAVFIHVACDEDGAVGGDGVAARARAALESSRMQGYNLLTKNCHQFCQYCLTGDADGTVLNCSFTSLEETLRDELGFTNWRRWDY